MALEYAFCLELVPRPSWDDALREFLSAMGRADAMSAIMPAGLGGNVYWEDPYCLIDSGPESPDSYPGDMLKEELGISINFGFGFRFWESIPWIPEILKGVNHLLGKSSRDAVFYFNGEYICLVRRGGRLYLNNDQGEWTSDWLQFITHPYEMIKLPILGMIDRSAQ